MATEDKYPKSDMDSGEWNHTVGDAILWKCIDECSGDDTTCLCNEDDSHSNRDFPDKLLSFSLKKDPRILEQIIEDLYLEIEEDWDSIERRDGMIIKTKAEQGEPDKNGYRYYFVTQTSDPDPTQQPDYGKPWTLEDINGGEDDPDIKFVDGGFGAMTSAGELPKRRYPLIYVSGTRYNTAYETDDQLLCDQLKDLGALEDRWTTYLGDLTTCNVWVGYDLNLSLWIRFKQWVRNIFNKYSKK